MGADNKSLSFESILQAALKVPTVYIDRKDFLGKELIKVCPGSQVETAITRNPALAGIDRAIINKIADDSIQYETNKVSLISFAAGLPGGFAMIGTIPADIIQYFAHILRMIQKLVYLYGWDELYDGKNMSQQTADLFTLFAGIMFGVNGAATAVTKLSMSLAQRTSANLAERVVVTQLVTPAAVKTAESVSIKVAKDFVAHGFGKVIPIIGGFASGIFTYATFKRMAVRLKTYLSRPALGDAGAGEKVGIEG